MSNKKSLMPDDFDPMAGPSNAAEMRAMIDGYAAQYNQNLPAIGAFLEEVPFRDVDGAMVGLDLIRPTGSGPFPIMVFIHGGAWICGSTASHRKFAFRFAECGFLVVSVNFRLAPEHPFPASLDDCVEAVKWAAANAGAHGGDISRLAVVGDSSGAKLAAAAVARLAGEKAAPCPDVLGLLYGYYDYEPMHRASIAATEGGANAGMGGIITRAYFGTADPDEEMLRNPGVSPIHAAASMPPTLLVCGSDDPFEEQHKAMAAALASHGIEHLDMIVPGRAHGFLQHDAGGDELPGCVVDVAAMLRTRLDGNGFPP